MMRLISSSDPFAYNDRMVTAEQVRAARGMLGLNQRQLAESASVPLSAVKALEAGKDVRVSVATAVERALIDAGLIFLEPGDVRDGGRGVRFRPER